MHKITKAVIAAAGYGTRMLPITKVLPKEVLPLVDKPIIQLVVEELAEAGIENIIIVTKARKSELVEYFGDIEGGLAEHLRNGDLAKEALLEQLEAVRGLANFAFVEQEKLYGTGTPVLDAAPYIGDEPFIYTFADDFFVAKQNSYMQMMAAYEQYDAPVFACQPRTADEDYKRYGYMGGDELSPGVIDVKAVIEQPGKENAPGKLASLGGFIVTPDVLPYLRSVREQLPDGKELFFNAALDAMVKDGKRVIAKEIVDAEYFDTGNKLEYMKTSVAMAVRHSEIGPQFRQFLNQFVKENISES